MTSHTETILTIFVALTGVAVLLQACILVGILISLRKTAKSLMEATEDLKATVVPMVHSTRELVQRITPQIVTVSSGLADLTEAMKRESAGVNISVTDIAQRVGRQMQRLDAMLTASLNAVEKATGVVETAVSAPVRQVNGILAAIRAVVETYRAETPVRRGNHVEPESPRMQ
jgi:methyl-accepting chemotaxis protein